MSNNGAHRHNVSTTVHVAGKRFRVTLDSRLAKKNNGMWDAGRKSRVFVNNPGPEKLGLAETPPFSPSGQDALVDLAWKQFNKLEVELMKLFAEAVVDGDLRFSRKAGCSSCPCSPGFVLNHPSSLMRGRNFWVRVEAF